MAIKRVENFEAGWPVPAGAARRSARRYRRVDLHAPVSISYPKGVSGPGVLSDLSVRGAAVIAPATPLLGDRVTLRIGDLGDLNGKVRRLSERGFAVELTGNRAARRALADALTVLLNQPHGFARAVRYPQSAEAVLQLDSGEIASSTILDLSETGARLSTSLIPPIGTSVRIGARRGTVERHMGGGIAVSFAVRSRT